MINYYHSTYFFLSYGIQINNGIQLMNILTHKVIESLHQLIGNTKNSREVVLFSKYNTLEKHGILQLSNQYK